MIRMCPQPCTLSEFSKRDSSQRERIFDRGMTNLPQAFDVKEANHE